MKNLSVNKIFLDKVLFHCVNPQIMKIVDLNYQDINQGDATGMNPSLFENSIVFNPNEIRQYLFVLSYSDQTFKINKFEQHHLGQLEIRWFNYLGDSGLLKIGPFKSSGEAAASSQGKPNAAAKFEIDLDVIATP